MRRNEVKKSIKERQKRTSQEERDLKLNKDKKGGSNEEKREEIKEKKIDGLLYERKWSRERQEEKLIKPG